LLYAQDATGIDAALISLSSQGQAAIPGAILNVISGFSNMIADRQAMVLSGAGNVQTALLPEVAFAYASTGPIADARAGAIPFPVKAPAARELDGPWVTWGQGYGRWSRIGDANGLPGSSSNSGGFVVGADRRLSPDLFAGGAFGYTRASISSADTNGAADTYAFGGYATWMPGAFVFDGRLVLGPAKTGTVRSITFPSTSMAGASVNSWGGLAAGKQVIVSTRRSARSSLMSASPRRR
jgi:outer membrane autotransporter protein